MPLSTCNQNDFLIKSKLNGFWGILLLLLDLACRHFRGLLTGVCTCLSLTMIPFLIYFQSFSGRELLFL